MKVCVYLGILSLYFSAASAIQCYVCNTHTDPACGDYFPSESPALKNSYLRTCPEEPDNPNDLKPFCRKTKTSFNDEIRIHRDCAYLRREKYDCYQLRAEDYVSNVCQCYSNFCNGAPTSVVASVALLVPFLIAAAL